MKKQNDVVIIFYMQGKVKTYIASSTWNSNQQIVPQFTTDYQKAFQWDNQAEATTIIKYLIDAAEKNYQSEWITVDQDVDFKFRQPGVVYH